MVACVVRIIGARYFPSILSIKKTIISVLSIDPFDI